MKLAVYKSLWGYPGTIRDAIPRIADAGYDGIEVDLPLTEDDRIAIQQGCRERDLALNAVGQLTQLMPEQQLEALRAFLQEASDLGAQSIVALSGCDEWSTAESIGFFETAIELEHQAGLRVAHETHRRHSLMAPWATVPILEAVPDLSLCCDFSHWVLVCERLLDPERDALDLVASRAVHLHTRVGSDQAPQVSDPRAAAAAAYVTAFETWWKLVWDAQVRAGFELSTVTPEYGPPPYQPSFGDPGSLEADLLEICDWQAARLRTLFDSVVV